MSMTKVWHIIGIQFNSDLDRDISVDYQVGSCDTVENAIKIAKEHGVKNITGAFISSMLVE